MGIFWETGGSVERPQLQNLIATALQQDPPENNAELTRLSQEQAAAALPSATDEGLKVGRLLAAVLIVAALLVGGVVTEAADLEASSKALLGLAATAFGIVVGLLGGEKPSK